ncbi:DNA/RNA polymerases superfamily protein [Gossypium australe]|uniref:DNA/RNA polymerases superfamily protein n=1 Tax=Gossypium australe TaxID=47621 RepID=A0A5B6VBU7_9ROSI|nr:DNA/RNA polymerases superfamily protein [Gossypium australe]
MQLSVMSDGGLLTEWQTKQVTDEELANKVRQVEQGMRADFALNNERVLCFRGRLFVPSNEELQ